MFFSSLFNMNKIIFLYYYILCGCTLISFEILYFKAFNFRIENLPNQYITTEMQMTGNL